MAQTFIITIIILTGYILLFIDDKFKFSKVKGSIIAGILFNLNLTKHFNNKLLTKIRQKYIIFLYYNFLYK